MLAASGRRLQQSLQWTSGNGEQNFKKKKNWGGDHSQLRGSSSGSGLDRFRLIPYLVGLCVRFPAPPPRALSHRAGSSHHHTELTSDIQCPPPLRKTTHMRVQIQRSNPIHPLSSSRHSLGLILHVGPISRHHMPPG